MNLEGHLYRSLVVLALATVAHAQLELPIYGYREASISSRGLVVRTETAIWVAARGEELRQLPLKLESVPIRTVALEGGIAFAGTFGLGFVSWDKLDETRVTTTELWVNMLVTDGKRALAVDEEGHTWSLDSEGLWTRCAAPLPGVLDLPTGECMYGHAGRWVYTTMVSHPTPDTVDAQSGGSGDGNADGSESDDPIASEHFACYWSDDGVSWNPATLPSDFATENVTAMDLVGGAELWAIQLSDESLLLSTDARTWSRSALPTMYDPWPSGFAIEAGRLFIADEDAGKTPRLHERGLEGAWSTSALPESSRVQSMFSSAGRVFVVGQRAASELPKLFSLKNYLVPYTPPALPAGASLRYVPTLEPVAGLRSVMDTVVAYISGAVNEPEPYPFVMGEQGLWTLVYPSQKPELNAAARAVKLSEGPPRVVGANGATLTLGDNGAFVLQTHAQSVREAQLRDQARIVSIAHGLGTWAALDAQGHVLLSRDALRWHSVTPNALRFEHLAGSSKELVAVTKSNEVLRWTSVPELPNEASTLAVDVTSPFARARDTVWTDLGPLNRGNSAFGADFDGRAITVAHDQTLSRTLDLAQFERLARPESPAAIRWHLASHAGRLFAGEWNDLSTAELTKVRSVVRWYSPDGVELGAHPLGDGVCIDSANDGRRVVILASLVGVGYGRCLLHSLDLASGTWSTSSPPSYSETHYFSADSDYRALGGIAYGNGLWMLAGYAERSKRESPAVWTSSDLKTWEQHALPSTVEALHTLRFARGQFVALSQARNGNATDVLTSTDGVDWSSTRLDSMPNARLAVGTDLVYLSSREQVVLASSDLSSWRSIVTPKMRPIWMAELDGSLCYIGTKRVEGAYDDGRLYFVRTPKPSPAVLARAPQRMSFASRRFAEHLEGLQRSLEDVRFERLAFAQVESFLREHGPLQEEEATAFVRAVLAKHRTIHMICRLAHIVDSDAVRAAVPSQLTESETLDLKAYWASTLQRSGHLAEKLPAAPQPPSLGEIAVTRPQGFDIGGAYERYTQGSVGAAFDLAAIYAEGEGVARDPQLAFEYGRRVVETLGENPSAAQLANAGSLRALFEVAMEDHNAGRYAQAAEKLWQAALLNSYDTMYGLGRLCIYEGNMAYMTVEQAYSWLVWTATKGASGEAMNLLGIAIDNGLGVPADPKLAARWFELGASFGSESAATNLKRSRDMEAQRKQFESMAEGFSLMNDVIDGVDSAFGDLTESMEALQQDTEPAADPKYPPGTTLGTAGRDGFVPERIVAYARADGDYRVYVRSTNAWKDPSTTPPTEHTLWQWRLDLVGITELDNFERGAQSWSACSNCERRGLVIQPDHTKQLCPTCSGRGALRQP